MNEAQYKWDPNGPKDVADALRFYLQDMFTFDRNNDSVVVTRGLLRAAHDEIERLRRESRHE